MFVARTRDENAINAQQAAAAAKPLNQGIKGLAPKTPANKPVPKTPFRGARQDENAKLDFGKAGIKDAKVDNSAFVTPANPRTRAPLGNKTTNQKALQTPALRVPEKDAKATSPRLRRSKIKVHETLASAHDVLQQDPEQRDIEYMPPREVPLNDDPDDILSHELNLEALKGKNLTRGWWSAYTGKEENDEDSELSDFEEKCKKAEVARKRVEGLNIKPTTKVPAKGTYANGPLKPPPSTVTARRAASALSSKRATSSSVPNAANPKTTSRARSALASTSAAKKPTPVLGNSRFTAAKAVSDSTIGYTKGRAVSASKRPPLSETTKLDEVVPAVPEKRTILDQILGFETLDVADEDSDPGFSATDGGLADLLGDGEPLFQLDPVEDL